MPFSGNTYTGPSGSTSAAAGQVVQSAVWNNIHTDLATALTTLMTQMNTNLQGLQNLMAPNGGFNVWQRGSSVAIAASTTGYTADRWYITTGANQASTISSATDLGTDVTPNHAAKVARNAGETGTTAIVFGYPFDSDEVYRMRGQYLSFKCLAKAGANWSPTSGTLTVTAAFGTGAAAKRGAGFTSETVLFTTTSNLTPGGSAATISYTSAAVVPLTAVQGELQFTWTPVGTAGADDSVTIDDCALVMGTLVQDYQDIPFAMSLDLCKRFYQKSFPYSVTPAQAAGQLGSVYAISAAASQVASYIKFAPELRSSPSVTFFNPSATTSTWVDLTTSVSVTASCHNSVLSAAGMGLYTINSISAANHTLMLHYSADASI